MRMAETTHGALHACPIHGAPHSWCCPPMVHPTYGAPHAWYTPTPRMVHSTQVHPTHGAPNSRCTPLMVHPTHGAPHSRCTPLKMQPKLKTQLIHDASSTGLSSSSPLSLSYWAGPSATPRLESASRSGVSCLRECLLVCSSRGRNQHLLRRDRVASQGPWLAPDEERIGRSVEVGRIVIDVINVLKTVSYNSLIPIYVSQLRSTVFNELCVPDCARSEIFIR